MSKDFDLIIVGGGMVGLTLANALAESELQIAIVEASPQDYQLATPYELRISALNRSSERLLENLGAAGCLATERCGHFDAMHVWEHRATGAIKFSAASIAEPHLGSIVENKAIQAALANQLESRDTIRWFCPALAQSLELLDNRVRLTLQDNSVLCADLIVGADGANSWVRQQTSIESVGWSYEQRAVVAVVQSEKEHQQVARQAFLPTGPLAFLPLGEANICSIVWSHTEDEARQMVAMSPEAFSEKLTEIMGIELGKVSPISSVASFPLNLRHSKQYVLPGLALIGDAAHTIHPLAGQGLNLGLKDAAALAQVITSAIQRHRGIGALATLRAYERWRKGDNLATMAAMEGFKRLFGHPGQSVKAVRNLGLNLTDRMQPLKHLFMHRAEGALAELPELMRIG